MIQTLIQVEDLSRRFGERVALHRLDFTLEAGEIVGLIGPNGSGKTTFLKILAGFLRPSKGRVRVVGLNPAVHRAAVMARVRFAFAPPPLYDALTAREHLRYLTAIGAKASGQPAGREIDGALDLVGLLPRADDRVRTFSFGMRQRLALAQALLPRPALLVLDEPTDGLDPLAVLELRGVLRGLRDGHGVAILLATHLLAEVDELVDRLLVLDEGRTLFSGRPDRLLRDGARIRLEVDDPPRAAAVLAAGGFTPAQNGNSGLTLPAGTLTLEEAAARLAEAGVKLIAFHQEKTTLESALLERMRAARDGPPPEEASP